jgi:hypothetical protein
MVFFIEILLTVMMRAWEFFPGPYGQDRPERSRAKGFPAASYQTIPAKITAFFMKHGGCAIFYYYKQKIQLL